MTTQRSRTTLSILQQRRQQRGLAAAGRARDQDVAALLDGLDERIVAVDHRAVGERAWSARERAQVEHRPRRLADRQGRLLGDGGDGPGDTLTRARHGRREERSVAGDDRADGTRQHAEGEIGVGGCQRIPEVGTAGARSIDEDATIGVAHHVGDGRLFQKSRDLRVERPSQPMIEPVFGDSLVRVHQLITSPWRNRSTAAGVEKALALFVRNRRDGRQQVVDERAVLRG